MLTLPDIRQAADYDCGAACVDTVLRFYGIRSTAAVLSMANGVQGTSPDTVEAMLRATGLKLLSGTMGLADLRHFTSDGRPVVCPVGIRGGHWVCVRGVFRNSVYYQDPLTGPAKATIADWLRDWRDATRHGHDYDRWGITVG